MIIKYINSPEDNNKEKELNSFLEMAIDGL
jgi:hypothetical protein